MRALPSPFTNAERSRYSDRLSVRQLEMSDTRVFDKPAACRARAFTWFDRTRKGRMMFGTGKVSGVLALAGAALALMLFWTPSARAATNQPTVTEIPPTSGSHHYPFDAAPTTASFPGARTIDLAARGYAEREFKLEGTTNIYRRKALWGSGGRWRVSVSQSKVPYTTRMLVRYPTDASKFNGTVIVEWLNDSVNNDLDPIWSQLYREILSQGYAYAGVTAQVAGVDALKKWDQKRYGALSFGDDGQSYDIFSQAAPVLRSDRADVLGGLRPKKVIAAGDSQGALRLTTYINAIQPRSHAFDSFFTMGRGAGSAQIGSGLVAISPTPAFIRTDNTTPLIQVYTEGDIAGIGTSYSRQPDNRHLRTWELAGASHLDYEQGLYGLNTLTRELGPTWFEKCLLGVQERGGTLADNMPNFEVADAALSALQRWMTAGVAPAHAVPIATAPFTNIVIRAADGVALGGIRLPELEVPTQMYAATNYVTLAQLNPLEVLRLITSGSIQDLLNKQALCMFQGGFKPFGHLALRALYPTHAAYVRRYKVAAKAALARGFLVESDYESAVARAQAAAIP